MKYWSLPVPAQPQGSAWWPGPKARAHMVVHIQSHRRSHSHKHRTCLCRRAASHRRSSSPVSPKFAPFPIPLFGMNQHVFYHSILQYNIFYYLCLTVLFLIHAQLHFSFMLSSFGCWRPWLWAISQCSAVSGSWYYSVPFHCQYCVLLS